MKKQLTHTLVNTHSHGLFQIKTMTKIVYMLLLQSIGPKPFLKIHWIHGEDLLETNGN